MLSWFMIFILLFDKIMNQNWIEMVNNNIWIILNSGLFISIFFIVVGFIGVFILLNNNKNYSIIGFILLLLGLFWFGSIQYYETLIYPIAAKYSVDVFNQIGMNMKNNLLMIAFLLSGIPWFLGFLIFGISMIKSKIFNKYIVILLIIGANFQLLGLLPVRTLGFVLMFISLLNIGIKLYRCNITE